MRACHDPAQVYAPRMHAHPVPRGCALVHTHGAHTERGESRARCAYTRGMLSRALPVSRSPLASRRATLTLLLLALLLGCGSGTRDGETTGASSNPTTSAGGGPTQERDPSADVRIALGVLMPPGTQQVHEQHGAGPEGADVSLIALATRSSEGAALAFVRALAGARETRAGCVDVSGASVCVTPPDRIPPTLLAPVRPVASRAPSWAQAWIAVVRASGPPPCPPCEDDAPTMPGCSC